MDPASLFITLIYQPFLNVLIFFYWLIGLVGEPDMGIAVILLTIVIRVLLLPLSLAGDKSETERRDIAARIKEIERAYESDPISLREQKKKVLRSSRTVLIAELVNLFIQVSIALMLWKMFGTGLSGEDFHLIYNFMPKVDMPFNLNFLGNYDLTHTSFRLNLLQSFLIFVVETMSVFTSPYPVTKGEVVRLQLVLPLVSFLVFMGLPAGKKLFVITSLLFSILLIIGKTIWRKFNDYRDSQEDTVLESAHHDHDEKIVVEVK